MRQRIAELHQRPVDTDFGQLVVPNVGSSVVPLVAACLKRGTSRNSSCDQLLSTLDSLDGSMPGRKVLGQIAGVSKTHVAEKEQALAAAMHFGGRVFIESLIAHLTAIVHRGEATLQAAIRFFSSDATVLPLGPLQWSSALQLPEVEPGAVTSYAKSENENVVTETLPRAKLHQSALTLVLFAPAAARAAFMLGGAASGASRSHAERYDGVRVHAMGVFVRDARASRSVVARREDVRLVVDGSRLDER